MSIIRSLLVSVGFKVDKASARNANKSISTLRLAMGALATAATYAFFKISEFLTDISRAAVNSSDLARSLGISIKEFTQLQRAASKFGLNKTEFGQSISRVNELLLGFRRGTSSALADIAKFTGTDLLRPGLTASDVFFDILTYLSKIRNVTDRQNIAGTIFGDASAARIADIAVNLEKFNDAVRESESLGDSAEKSLPDLKEYNLAVNELLHTFKQIAMELSIVVIPAINSLTEKIRMVADLIRSLAGYFSALASFDSNKTATALSAVSKATTPFIEKGIEAYGNLVEKVKQSTSALGEDLRSILPQSFIRLASGFNVGMMGSQQVYPQVTVNNEINLPAGTTQEQAQSLNDSIQENIYESVANVFRQIQYNTPVAE